MGGLEDDCTWIERAERRWVDVHLMDLKPISLIEKWMEEDGLKENACHRLQRMQR